MTAEAFVRGDELLGRRAWVPEHVVYRDFVTETVVLNLETGHYHGVNRTGGAILAALERAETVGAAARAGGGVRTASAMSSATSVRSAPT